VGAGVDGNAFAQDGSIADDDAGRAAFEFEILRGTTDPGKGVYDAFRPDGGAAIDHGVRHQLGARADFYAGANHTIRTEFNAFAKLCTLFDNRSRMKFTHKIILRS